MAKQRKHTREREAIKRAIWKLGEYAPYKEVQRIVLEELDKHTQWVEQLIRDHGVEPNDH